MTAMVEVAGVVFPSREPDTPSSMSHSSGVRSRPPALTSVIRSRSVDAGSSCRRADHGVEHEQAR